MILQSLGGAERKMLTDLCAYLKNWFDEDEFHRKLPRWEQEFTITDGKIDLSGKILDGQMFRIYGSMLNDGVYIYNEDLTLIDETFTGLIQSMRTEPDFIKLVNDINEWLSKYGTATSTAMSPFNSESFGGYSYSKAGNGTGGSDGAGASPYSVFGARMARWKKI